MTEIERLYRNTINSVPERRRYEQEVNGGMLDYVNLISATE
jgi:hypothetical protein